MKRIYVCKDEVTELLSAVYDAWRGMLAREAEEYGIRFFGQLEQELFCEYREVMASEKKAAAVEKLILSHMGWYTYKMLYQAALSADPMKGDAILGAMEAARHIPDSHRIMDHLGNPFVEQIFKLSRNVGNESVRWIELLRFRELKDQFLYARFEPKCRVLTLVAPHFTERLSVENWVIHDVTHGEYAVHEAGKKWVLVSGGTEDVAQFEQLSEREQGFAELWKLFVNTIAIQERTNLRCQMGHLPLWCRTNLTEFETSTAS